MGRSPGAEPVVEPGSPHREKGKFDFVTEADKASEKAILSEIQSRHPDHLILAEESAKDWTQGSLYSEEHLWVVDPLDGTTNFIHGFPSVAVSVAVLQHGQPLAGVVVDVTRKEEFAALKGKGAWLDGNPMRVSRTIRAEPLPGAHRLPFPPKAQT
jgi:myo-inositol-1(or 4)-monophosphatase